MQSNRIGAMGAAALAAISFTAAQAQAQDQSQQPLTQRKETMESAVETPAEDLNLKQTPIPEVLQRAVANPYDMRTLEACPAIVAEMQRLETALGPDRDEPPTPDTRTVEEKREGGAAAALKLGIEAVTPYRGIIRWATGATAYARTVQEAIEAGFARRGFLKGMAVKMNCPPPAAPAWFRPASPPPARQQASQPVYAAPQDYRDNLSAGRTYSTARADDDEVPPYRYATPTYEDERYDERSYSDDRTGRSYRYERVYPDYQPYGYDRYGRYGYDYDR